MKYEIDFKVYKHYMVLDLESGLMDGWYGREEDAIHAASTRQTDVGGRWIALQLADTCNQKIALRRELCDIGYKRAMMK